MKKSDFLVILKRRGLFLIIILALVIRLSFFVSFQPWAKDLAAITETGSDGSQYHQLAENLKTDMSFERFGTYRTPGYPVFLAIIYSFSSNNIWPVFLVQIGLSIISLVLVYKIGSMLFSENIGLFSSLLFAIDIYQASYTVTLLTDTLFVCLFIASVYFLCKGFERYNFWEIFASSFFLGLATLVRPISFLFPTIAIIAILILFRSSLKIRFVSSLLFIFVFIVVLSPWLIRNFRMYNEAKLTSISGENLLLYNVAYTEVYKTGEPIEIIRQKLIHRAVENGANMSDTLSFKNSIIYSKIAKKYIKENFVLYCEKSLLGVLNMFINLDTNYLGTFFQSKTGTIDLFGTSNIFSLVKVFFKTKSFAEIVIAFLVIPFMLVNYMLSVFGLYWLMKEKNKTVLFFLLIICYFCIVTGVVGVARYKLPFMPIINVLCAVGFSVLYLKFKKKRLVSNS